VIQEVLQCLEWTRHAPDPYTHRCRTACSSATSKRYRST
jgi:hypothetical protein